VAYHRDSGLWHSIGNSVVEAGKHETIPESEVLDDSDLAIQVIAGERSGIDQPEHSRMIGLRRELLRDRLPEVGELTNGGEVAGQGPHLSIPVQQELTSADDRLVHTRLPDPFHGLGSGCGGPFHSFGQMALGAPDQAEYTVQVGVERPDRQRFARQVLCLRHTAQVENEGNKGVEYVRRI